MKKTKSYVAVISDFNILANIVGKSLRNCKTKKKIRIWITEERHMLMSRNSSSVKKGT